MPEDNRAAASCARGGHDGGHDDHVDSGDHDGEGGEEVEEVDLLSLHFSAIH